MRSGIWCLVRSGENDTTRRKPAPALARCLVHRCYQTTRRKPAPVLDNRLVLSRPLRGNGQYQTRPLLGAETGRPAPFGSNDPHGEVFSRKARQPAPTVRLSSPRARRLGPVLDPLRQPRIGFPIRSRFVGSVPPTTYNVGGLDLGKRKP